jgi:hypothetical protein
MRQGNPYQRFVPCIIGFNKPRALIATLPSHKFSAYDNEPDPFRVEHDDRCRQPSKGAADEDWKRSKTLDTAILKVINGCEGGEVITIIHTIIKALTSQPPHCLLIVAI